MQGDPRLGRRGRVRRSWRGLPASAGEPESDAQRNQGLLRPVMQIAPQHFSLAVKRLDHWCTPRRRRQRARPCSAERPVQRKASNPGRPWPPCRRVSTAPQGPRHPLERTGLIAADYERPSASRGSGRAQQLLKVGDDGVGAGAAELLRGARSLVRRRSPVPRRPRARPPGRSARRRRRRPDPARRRARPARAATSCSACEPVTTTSKRSAIPANSSAAATRSPEASTPIRLPSLRSRSIHAIEPGNGRTSP